MRISRGRLERRLTEQERARRSKRSNRPAIVEYHYTAGATGEEMEAARVAAREKYLADHPECDPRRPAICLGLPTVNLEVET